MKRILLVLTLLLLVGCSMPYNVYTVWGVIDGDTFTVKSKDVVFFNCIPIRLIGINTPERGEPGGLAATRYLSNLVEDRRVKLVYGKQKHDVYGRVLAYVYVEDTFVNLALIEAGHARPMRIEPNTKHAAKFQAAWERSRRK